MKRLTCDSCGIEIIPGMGRRHVEIQTDSQFPCSREDLLDLCQPCSMDFFTELAEFKSQRRARKKAEC